MKTFARDAINASSKLLGSLVSLALLSFAIAIWTMSIPVMAQTPSAIATTLKLRESTTPVVVGESAFFGAELIPATYGVIAGGTVTFFEGTTVLGTSPLVIFGGSGPNGIGYTYNAELRNIGLTLGTHTITAVYSGDKFYAPSTSAAITVTVVPVPAAIATTLKLRESTVPVVVGESAFFGAELIPVTYGVITAGGTVTFFEGTTALGTSPLVIFGGSGPNGIGYTYNAELRNIGLTLGTHTITAVYSGDKFYAPSTSAAITVTVVPVPAAIATTLKLRESTVPVVVGESAFFGAELIPATYGVITAGGTVTFFEGTTALGTSGLAIFPGPNGIGYTYNAELRNIGLTLGTHTITAVYSGDKFYAPSTSAAVTVTITPAPRAPGQSFSGPTATSSGNAKISFTGGGALCGFTYAAFVPLVGGAASPPAGTAPAGVAFRHGLIDFVTSGCTPGSTLTFVVTTPAPLSPSTQYWKYGPTASNTAPHWYAIPAVTVGNTVTFTITDGGLGDDDLLANGTIVDQGGPGALVVRATGNDLNGDSKSDLLVQTSAGTTAAWLMNGSTISSAATLLDSDPNWTISHIADFNGDGKADILWRNTNGAVTLWLMNGSTVLSTMGLLGADANWRVSHVGDFNGDGKADLLWRNTNGAATIWLMNGTSVTSAVGILGADANWSVSHIGDFNGDGKADLLWRNTNGAATIWLMNGTAVASAVGILGADANWSVSHVGDFNGDGKTDLLWRNNNGAVTIWLMNGTTVTTTAGILGADANWSVSHIGDFNGDGQADLLWRNTNGAVTMWLMNGAVPTATAGLIGADPNWRVSHVGDLDGDGKSDLIWRKLDGSITAWTMNGVSAASTAGLAGPGAWRVIP